MFLVSPWLVLAGRVWSVARVVLALAAFATFAALLVVALTEPAEPPVRTAWWSAP